MSFLLDKIPLNTNSKPSIPLKLLDVPFEEQGYENWCWVACGTMLWNYNNPKKKISKETFSQNYLGKSVECDSVELINNEACNKWLPLDKIKTVFYKILNQSATSNANINLAYDTIAQLINVQGKPIMIGIVWEGEFDVGHLVIGKGIFRSNSIDYMVIHDPNRARDLNIKLSKLKEGYDNARSTWYYTWI